MADPIATNPELYSVAFENERVRVLRYRDSPGDRTQPHSHPDSVMITASAFDRRLHHGGRSVDVSMPAGEVRWLDAQEHSGENIGDTETVTFFVELKDTGAGGPGASADDEAPLGPR
ncbi:MAG: cytoplasmic protein [Dermatophilaceae bacterium]